MQLFASGQVFATKNEIVEPRAGQTFQAFQSREIAFLRDDGMGTVIVRAGRDFPVADFNKLQAGDLVSLKVFVSKGNIYAESISEHKPAVKAS